jgi:hypothetical protein
MTATQRAPAANHGEHVPLAATFAMAPTTLSSPSEIADGHADSSTSPAKRAPISSRHTRRGTRRGSGGRGVVFRGDTDVSIPQGSKVLD